MDVVYGHFCVVDLEEVQVQVESARLGSSRKKRCVSKVLSSAYFLELVHSKCAWVFAFSLEA